MMTRNKRLSSFRVLEAKRDGTLSLRNRGLLGWTSCVNPTAFLARGRGLTLSRELTLNPIVNRCIQALQPFFVSLAPFFIHRLLLARRFLDVHHVAKMLGELFLLCFLFRPFFDRHQSLIRFRLRNGA